jgi:hypothetical protein
MLDAAAEILDEGSAEVRIMAEFVMSSTRGVTKPSRRGRRAEENPGASPDHQ